MTQGKIITETQVKYRVWPDGTIQSMEDAEEPYSWMSDDFVVVLARSEEEAFYIAFLK